MHGIPAELNISMLTSRAYTEDEAKAWFSIVPAE
jgi:hypothetical protein